MAVIIQRCPKCGDPAIYSGTIKNVDFYELDLRDVEGMARRYSVTELIAIHDALADHDIYFYCALPVGCGNSFSYSDSGPDPRRLAVAQFLFGPKPYLNPPPDPYRREP